MWRTFWTGVDHLALVWALWIVGVAALRRR